MSCPKCGGSGLLPFEKNGRVIPNAWLDCLECKRIESEHYRESTPDDFDFPCSDSFREFFSERVDNPRHEEAATFEREEQAPTPEKTPGASQYRLDQLQGNLISLRDILKQHVNETKPRREKGQY